MKTQPTRDSLAAAAERRRAPAEGEAGLAAAHPPAIRRRDLRSAAVVSLALAAMAILLATGAVHDSPTIDEPNHILRGMAILETGDARLSYSHPPLANALQAIPATLAGNSLEIADQRGFARWNLDQVIRDSIAGDYEGLRAAIVSGRFVTAALALLLGLYLFFFARELFGARAARFAVLLYALHPVFLAHGRQVTTDLPLALGALLVAGELTRYLGSRSPWRLLRLGLALGFACAVKFSALFLVPPLLLSMVAGAFRGLPRFPAARWPRRLLAAGRDFALVGLLTILAVNAAYGFQRTGLTVGETLDHEPQPMNWIVRREKGDFLEATSFLPSLPRWMPIPLPYSYVYGLFTVKAQSDRGHGGWFLGERRGKPHRLYFPLMLVVKSPATHLLLGLAGLVLVFGRRRERWWQPLDWPIVLMPLFFFGVLLPSGIQIGVRHAMPVAVFLFLFAGWTAARLWARARWGKAVVAGLLLLLLVETGAAHPHHLGHFSWLIGGAPVGHRISIVGEDWGQDVGDLARLAREEGLEPLYYRPYGGTARSELRFHGGRPRAVRCGKRAPSNGWVAVHAAQALRSGRPCLPEMGSRPPDRILNHHIWLYRMD